LFETVSADRVPTCLIFLFYLYETYYRPDACPDTAALVKKLSAVGFPEDEISEALDWLTGLASKSGSVVAITIKFKRFPGLCWS
jgi:uncharacterized protein Smg (DUF494 family)